MQRRDSGFMGLDSADDRRASTRCESIHIHIYKDIPDIKMGVYTHSYTNNGSNPKYYCVYVVGEGGLMLCSSKSHK